MVLSWGMLKINCQDDEYGTQLIFFDLISSTFSLSAVVISGLALCESLRLEVLESYLLGTEAPCQPTPG